jgi:hypothetical protein
MSFERAVERNKEGQRSKPIQKMTTITAMVTAPARKSHISDLASESEAQSSQPMWGAWLPQLFRQ